MEELFQIYSSFEITFIRTFSKSQLDNYYIRYVKIYFNYICFFFFFNRNVFYFMCLGSFKGSFAATERHDIGLHGG